MVDQASQAKPKRVFVVEDHPIVRMGLKQLLSLEPSLELCGESERVDEAIEMIGNVHPHVVLVDIALPGDNGINLIHYIKQHWVGTKIIVVSTYDETIYGPIAIDAGADCYINKHEAMDKIINAIHSVLESKTGGNGNGNSGRRISHWFG